MAHASLENKGQFLLVATFVPFALPFAVTLLLVLLVGNHFPRDLAAGSSLVLSGLVAGLVVMVGVNAHVARRWPAARARQLALILSGATTLMGWPLWTMGVLPSVNGMALGELRVTSMRLEGLEVTRASKGRQLYYWARLAPDGGADVGPDAKLGAGRYFIPREVHDRWQQDGPATVRVGHARGLLGAEIVRDYQ